MIRARSGRVKKAESHEKNAKLGNKKHGNSRERGGLTCLIVEPLSEEVFQSAISPSWENMHGIFFCLAMTGSHAGTRK